MSACGVAGRTSLSPLLSLERRQLADRLKQGLASVPELNPAHEKPAPTWRAQVSTG